MQTKWTINERECLIYSSVHQRLVLLLTLLTCWEPQLHFRSMHQLETNCSPFEIKHSGKWSKLQSESEISSFIARSHNKATFPTISLVSTSAFLSCALSEKFEIISSWIISMRMKHRTRREDFCLKTRSVKLTTTQIPLSGNSLCALWKTKDFHCSISVRTAEKFSLSDLRHFSRVSRLVRMWKN